MSELMLNLPSLAFVSSACTTAAFDELMRPSPRPDVVLRLMRPHPEELEAMRAASDSCARFAAAVPMSPVLVVPAGPDYEARRALARLLDDNHRFKTGMEARFGVALSALDYVLRAVLSPREARLLDAPADPPVLRALMAALARALGHGLCPRRVRRALFGWARALARVAVMGLRHLWRVLAETVPALIRIRFLQPVVQDDPPPLELWTPQAVIERGPPGTRPTIVPRAS